MNEAPVQATWPLGRWSSIGALLLGEYLAVSLTFDAQPLRDQFAWVGWSGEAATVGLVALTAVIALWKTPQTAHLTQLGLRLRRRPALRIPFIVHGAALAMFFWMSRQVFGGGLAASPSPGLMLTAWTTLVVLVAATAVAMAVPIRAIPALARFAARPLAVGVLGGMVAWAIGRLSESLWPHASRATLAMAASVLRPFAHGELFKDPDQFQLGLGPFIVEVSAGCSGVQGMGLMAALSAAYLLRFRRALLFPKALVVLPIGVAGAFLANVLRIAALIWIGRWISPDVATGGFHSTAGWMLTSALALALLAWVRRSPALSRHAAQVRGGEAENPSVPYLVPLLVNLGLTLATAAVVSGFDLLYPVRVFGVVATMALVLPWRRISESLRTDGRALIVPMLIGGVVSPLWIAATHHVTEDGAMLQAGLTSLSTAGRVGWLATRVVGVAFVAPVVEELAFRGFLLRRMLQPNFDAVAYQVASRRPVAVLASALAFGVLHKSIVAGSLAGAAYGLVLRRRGRLVDAVIAHSVTNSVLVVFALATSQYGLLG